MNEVLGLLLAVFEGFVVGSYMDLKLNLKSEAYSKWFIVCSVGVINLANLMTKVVPVKVILITIGISLVGKQIYKASLKQLLRHMVVYYGLVAIVEISMVAMIQVIWDVSLETLALKPNDFYLVGLTCTAIVMVMTRILSEDNPIKKKVAWGYWSVIVLSNVCTVILVIGIMTVGDMNHMPSSNLVTVVTVGTSLAILNLFHCYIYVALKDEHQKENQYALIRNAAQDQYQYMLENEKSLGVVRKVRHDLNNQMIGLDYLLEKSKIEEARAYVHKISQALEVAEIKYITGYPIIDTIINQKYELCKLYDISMNCEVGELTMTSWSPQDVCVVLGNALDNAIEATKELPIGKRKIVIKMYMRKQYVVTVVTNTYKACKEQKKLITRKDKKWHGIGLKSIKEVVKKYDGEVYINMDDQMFTLKIVVPIEGN